MWIVYAIPIWMAGVLFIDLLCDRKPSPWLWPLWLPPVLVWVALRAVVLAFPRPTKSED